MVVLSLVCAVILSVLASALAKPQAIAKEIDRSKQMMIAAHLLSHHGYFLVQDKQGKDVPAKYTTDGLLEPAEEQIFATSDQILKVYARRFKAKLVDHQGNLTTFAEAKLSEKEYIADFQKTGYYKELLMLIYEILPNAKDNSKPIGYIIPVNGYGLWDAIYGYLAVDTNGNNVIGISWYDQKETPGLGANISEEYWQSLFPGKHVFQESPNGTTDFKTAPLGITVVKGKVNEVYGDSPRAKSAVDGMPGATLTGNGVTEAYKYVLAAYRPFLMKLEEQKEKSKP